MNAPRPAHMELTEDTIKIILSKPAYIPEDHLFNDPSIEQEMKRRVSDRTAQCEFI